MQNRYTTLISIDDFIAAKMHPDTIIFDCRFYLADVAKGRKEYLQSHIPGAVYLDVNHDLSSPIIKGVTGRHPLPHPEILTSTLKSSGMNNESQVIVYDQSNGAYASRAWWLLRWLGHNNVAVLDGGFKAWNAHELPVENQWPLPSPGNFESDVQNEMTVKMESLDPVKAPLIDSREYQRYTGEVEPIDPVAGHIPGAVCVPYMGNTNEEGVWKNADELKKRFSEIESSSMESPVFYCGSGVTACHNILAYKIATGKDARLYPGSWSEWINYKQ
ncbi:MAG: sulfurtransferase [Saprospiraceae bacterium]|uniref:Sulfurtransferase n=1 Tax=Candidatus Opimibacter skivensis TaxID=2982028 RepID=A0A9D7SQQ1_9BACT|nr:sulfurtransferase [Candidatus Opimibacter skivensis]